MPLRFLITVRLTWGLGRRIIIYIRMKPVHLSLSYFTKHISTEIFLYRIQLHVSPQADTMEFHFQNEKIRNNFKKLSPTHAKCRHCDVIIEHTTFNNFPAHIEAHEIFEEEERRKSDPYWKYIRKLPPIRRTEDDNTKPKYHCVICRQDLMNIENCSSHAHNDYNIISMDYYKEWQWKYIQQYESDLEAKCSVCESQMIDFHFDYLIDHIREAHVSLFKTMALNFEDEDIRDNFEKLSFTEAKCKWCNVKFTDDEVNEKVLAHVQIHDAHSEMENMLKEDSSYKYMRCSNNFNGYQCVFCKKDFLDNGDTVNIEWPNHTHVNDIDNFDTFIRTFYAEWQWKYFEQVNDSKIKCYVCSHEISSDFCSGKLMNHIKELHSNLFKMPLKFETEEIEKKFIKLSFTRAECRDCHLEFIHTYMRKFNEHIQSHEHIVKFEKPTISPYIPRKYARLNQTRLKYQCVLCKESVGTDYDAAKWYKLHNHESDKYASIVKNYDKWQWEQQWKYREVKQEKDSEVKCYACPSKILIDFCNDDLMNHIEECGKKLEALNVTDLRLNIRDKQILRHFEHFSNMTAQCTICSSRIGHTTLTNLKKHIDFCHNHIFLFEDNKPSHKYILCKKPDSPNQCVLCKGIIINDDDYSDHENQYHKNNYTLRKILYDVWELKYFKRKSNYYMQCNFCSMKIVVIFQPKRLKIHLKLHDLDSSSLAGTQQHDVGIEDTPGASSLAGTQQHDVGIEDTPGTQQHDVDIEDTPGASSQPGTSRLSLPKKRKRDDSSS